MKLLIAEKPSVAKGIAPVLKATKSENGYMSGNGYIVSWCYGHLVGLYMPNDYGNEWAETWSFKQLPMLPEKWKFKIKKDCQAQVNVLKTLMNSSEVDEIICATDADREGECIFRYVYYLLGCRKPVKRLWLSSLEEAAITSALNSMKPMSVYDSLFSAGFSRAKADWLVGMNGSRLFSCRYNQRLTLGRVQTPTLAMVVKRDYEVNNFVKQKYFTVDLNCGFIAVSDRIDDESQADTLLRTVTGKNAVVSELKKEVKSINPPKLYDLTTLQREANKKYGYTAQQTLDFIQSLYEAKLTTYPRTDSQYLSDDMEESTLNVISIIGNVYTEYAPYISTPDIKRCINNSKVGGHHAIIPTSKIGTADLSALSDGQQNILRLIAVKLIMATSSAHKYKAVKVTVTCENAPFYASGKSIIENGWKEIESKFNSSIKNLENDNDAEDNKELPELTEGQTFNNVSASKSEHWTSPPKHYTEDTLLSAMERAGNDEYDDETEKKGLGTPATRAAIIESLVVNQYVERKKKQIIATEKGIKLISIVPDEVKSPKMTAEWEQQLQRIESGNYQATDFMTGIIAYINDLCGKYGNVDNSVEFKQPDTALGKCPKCNNDVKKGKFGFYCTGKCGMNVAKVYGKDLTETQITNLLGGKSISYTKNGNKTIVMPEVVENQFNGKTYYQWKTELKKGK